MKRIIIFTTILVFLFTARIQSTWAEHWVQLPPSADLSAPEISHRLFATSALDAYSNLHIRAEITDNFGIKEAYVFFRQKSTDPFEMLSLKLVKGTNFYETVLPQMQLADLEYYFQATDYAGNAKFHGNPALPLKIEIPNLESPNSNHSLLDQDTQESEVDKRYKIDNRWILFGLTVIVAGAIYDHQHYQFDRPYITMVSETGTIGDLP